MSVQRAVGMRANPSRLSALLVAFIVTVLWSTSWVLIKIGLRESGPLIFVGLRYFLAFLILLPFGLRAAGRAELKKLTRSQWLTLAFLGVFYYFATQSAQYVGLDFLPSVTVSLMYNLSASLITLISIWLLREKPTGLQWLGVAVNLAGILIYFTPLNIPVGAGIGLVVVAFGVLSNAVSAVVSRGLNRELVLSPLTVTLVSMGVGGTLMLGTGLAVEGWPQLSLQGWGIVVWLAALNTALAFTLWNYSMRALKAMESSLMSNLMLIFVAGLAFWILGEGISARQGLGMILALAGTVLVQVRQLPGRLTKL